MQTYYRNNTNWEPNRDESSNHIPHNPSRVHHGPPDSFHYDGRIAGPSSRTRGYSCGRRQRGELFHYESRGGQSTDILGPPLRRTALYWHREVGEPHP